MAPLPDYQLRPTHPEDLEFLARLYASTRADELELAGFPLALREAFCRMQFNARQLHYSAYFAAANDSIIESAGAAVGRELILRDANQILLVDIALLPEFRRRGIGSDRLRAVIAESQKLRCPIRLHAEQGSRAVMLYHRHGFAVKAEQGIHFLMERSN